MLDKTNNLKKLDFKILKEEVIDYLEKNTKWILATSLKDKVTARSMSIINNELTIYFQTDKRSRKYQQIVSNNNIAIAHDNYQIEGIAQICGHPISNGNEFFYKKYKSVHKSAFERYSFLKDEVVIKIIPELVIIYKYINSLPYKDYLSINEEKAYREKYSLE
ncbi:MAG: hypothetical protein MUP02_01700 [Actinobacteria bacterium]|nr:hypothetical protein [Actinomycetota bacterium]